jgi:hypothetical protein
MSGDMSGDASRYVGADTGADTGGAPAHEAVGGRVCAEVQAQLPALAAGTLPRWRRRLVELHLRRCPTCAAEQARQAQVTAQLAQLRQHLGATAGVDGTAPPAGLLDALLEQADQPGLRGRAAVPARGAISGARPALSAALLLAGAAAGTAVGYGTWRAISRAGRTRRRR